MTDTELSPQLISRVESGHRSIIPKSIQDEGMTFYGIAKDARGFHLLNEEIRSWLNSPISKSITVLSHTPTEFSDLTDQQIFSVEISEGWEHVALQNLEKLLQLWNLEPAIELNIKRPIGRILRDFYRAINAGKKNHCESALKEIEKSNLLNASNLHYLKIELIAKLGTSEELLGNSDLGDILRLHRPAKITDLIARAIDEIHITPESLKDTPNWEDLSEEIRNTFPPIIRHNAHVLSVSGARCLAISKLFSIEKNESLKNTIDYLNKHWSHDSVISEILEKHPHPEILTEKQTNTIEQLERCLSDGEGRNIEYKSTLTTPVGSEGTDAEPPHQRVLENACIKTVAAFLNTNGGTLLIGVQDDNTIFGLEKDYERLRKEGKGDRDRFILHFTQLLKNSLGPLAESKITIDICEYESVDIAVVTVPKSDDPVIADMKVTKKQRENHFYYRTAAGTVVIDDNDELKEYCSKFPGSEVDAETYFFESKFELCIEAALKVDEPSVSTCTAALHSADQLRDNEISKKVVAMFNTIPESQKKELLNTKLIADIYQRLTSQIGGTSIPADWLDWLTGDDWRDDPSLLDSWAENWQESATLASEDINAIALALIDALGGINRDRTLNGLPLFITWLIQEKSTLPSNLIGLSVTCYETILDSNPGEMEYEECIRLLRVILNSSCTKTHYVECLVATNNHIETLGANAVIWLCEVLELVAAHTVGDANEYANFRSMCDKYYRTHFKQFSSEDKTVLRQVLPIIEIEVPHDTTESTVITQRFKKVGIYSLQKKCAEGAKTLIQAEWPDVSVEIDSDSKVDGTVKNMAERVDVLLIHTSQITHGVSDYGHQENSLRVHGGCATRLFRELVSWANHQ